MKNDPCKVKLFIDDNTTPIAELNTPIQFDLDTHKLPDGEHKLKIVSKSFNGKEGVKIIPFIVRNGPAIDIEGLKDRQVVDGSVPLMINAYDKNTEHFNIVGSETPKSIPSWLWIIIITFFAWAMFYMIYYFDIPEFLTK